MSTVVEAGIGSSDERILEDGCYGFAMVGSVIALVRGMSSNSQFSYELNTNTENRSYDNVYQERW